MASRAITVRVGSTFTQTGRTAVDSIGLLDAVALGRRPSRTDPIGLLDAVSRVAAGVRASADLVGVLDVATGTKSSATIGSYEPTLPLTGYDGTYVAGGAVSTGALTVVSNGGAVLSFTTNNALYDSMDYACYVRASTNLTGVTWTRTRFRGDNRTLSGNTALLDFNSAGLSGLVAQDCTFQPDFPNLWIDGIIGHDYTATRCKVLNTVDGFGVYNINLSGNYASNVTIHGCFVDQLAYFTPDPNHGDNHTHNDCVQVQAGTNITIYGNAFKGYLAPGIGQYASAGVSTSNTCVIINRISGTSLDVTIDTNWLYGGGYTVNIAGTITGAVGSVTNNVLAHDNAFKATADMIIAPSVTFTAFSGNVRSAAGGGGSATVYSHT